MISKAVYEFVKIFITNPIILSVIILVLICDYIKSNKYDKNWIMYAGKNKYYYVNSIRQNYVHVKAISKLLNIDKSKVYNIVCTPSIATLKIDHDGELIRYNTIANKILSYKNEVIDNEEEIV